MCKTQKKKHFIVPCYLWQFPLFFCTFPLCNFRYPNPSDRLIFVKVTGTFLGTNTNKILVFVIDDSLGMGGGVWWGRVVVQNLPSERKLPMGKVQKKVKKKLTNQHFRLHIHKTNTCQFFFTFFYFAPFPNFNDNFKETIFAMTISRKLYFQRQFQGN